MIVCADVVVHGSVCLHGYCGIGWLVVATEVCSTWFTYTIIYFMLDFKIIIIKIAFNNVEL